MQLAGQIISDELTNISGTLFGKLSSQVSDGYVDNTVYSARVSDEVLAAATSCSHLARWLNMPPRQARRLPVTSKLRPY